MVSQYHQSDFYGQYLYGILLVFGLETGSEPADSLPEVQKRCPAGTCTT